MDEGPWWPLVAVRIDYESGGAFASCGAASHAGRKPRSRSEGNAAALHDVPATAVNASPATYMGGECRGAVWPGWALSMKRASSREPSTLKDGPVDASSSEVAEKTRSAPPAMGRGTPWPNSSHGSSRRARTGRRDIRVK